MKILSVVAALTAVTGCNRSLPQSTAPCGLPMALLKKQRDWPVVLANAPGIFLGLITFVTSIMKF